jgi:hypothetical protein
MTKYSEVMEVHTGKRLKDVEYVLFDKAGKPTKFKGAYYICDGGFHKWRCLQVCAAFFFSFINVASNIGFISSFLFVHLIPFVFPIVSDEVLP